MANAADPVLWTMDWGGEKKRSLQERKNEEIEEIEVENVLLQ